MSLVVFMPIMLALFSILYLCYMNGMMKEYPHHHYWSGLSIFQWMWITMVIFPVLAGLLLLWKGTLRVGFVLMVAPALLCIPVGSVSPPKASLAPEKRAINIAISYYQDRRPPDGTDVYCNGVHLGQTPLKMTVAEFLDKVKPWTTPPPQKWFDTKPCKLYSWFPWDGFIRERREQYSALSNDDFEKFTSTCQYWWRFEFQGAELCFYNTWYRETGSFDKIMEYEELDYQERFAPSIIPHVDLLLNVYPHLTDAEKQLWTEHVLKHFDLLQMWMFKQMPKEAKQAVARLHYKLSDKPTASECRAALEQLAQENADMRGSGYRMVWDYPYHFGHTEGPNNVTKTTMLGPVAMSMMGEAAAEPLAELIRKYRYDEKKISPILYAAGIQTGPGPFDELVRYFAVAHTNANAVWKNQNEKVLPLFQTHYRWATMADLFTMADVYNREEAWATRIVEAFLYYNPLTEPFLRSQMEAEFPKMQNRSLVMQTIGQYVRHRWRLKELEGKEIDREELIQWVKSVLGPGNHEASLDKTLSQARQSDANYPALKGRIGLLFNVTDQEKLAFLTFERVADWLKANPENNVIDFFAHNYNNDTARREAVFFVQTLLFKEFFSDPDESAKMLQNAWADPGTKRIVLAALERQFVEELSLQEGWNRRQQEENRRRNRYYAPPAEDTSATRFRIPGVYGIHEGLTDQQGSLRFSAALYPIFEALSDTEQEELCIRIARELAAQDSPEVLELLQKWSESDNPRVKRAASETLQGALLRERIRSESKALFLDLAAGKIRPDDLLPEPPKWVWREGEYKNEK